VRIDRCVCYSRSFAELKTIADASGSTDLVALQSAARLRCRDFGGKCKLCHPYGKAMLRTGQTVFGEILVDDPDELNPSEDQRKVAV